MPEPLSIFSAKFLYYESIENPTEILSEAIISKIEDPIPTSVFIVLYSHGFYIKGNLQHISHEKRKSRSYQFISVDLLRKVYQCSFHNDFIIIILYETMNQIMEVILITFPFSLINECHRFHHYIQTLLNDKFCSIKMFNILSSKFNNQYFDDVEMTDKNNESIELKIPVSMSNLKKDTIQTNTLTFTDIPNKFDETTSEEIVDSSYLSDSSNDLNDVILKRNNNEYQTPVNYSEKIEITNENIETFIEKTVYKTKRSSLFYDEQPETLNSIDSIETFCQNDDDTDCNNCFENNSNSSFDERDPLSSISNINEDYGNLNEISFSDKKCLTNVNFPNQMQTRKLLDSLNSIEEYKPNSFQSFDIYGNLIDEDLSFQESNDRKLSKYACFNNVFSNNDDDVDNNNNSFINHNLSKSQNKNMFCWPDFLKNESKFTTSILVEMSFSFHQINNNWNLIDKTNSLNDKISRKRLEWHEKVDRIHYNYNKKKFETHDNGSLVIYCCRQVGNESENSD